MAVSTPVIKGLTTINWGSKTVMDKPSGAIVESASITPKNSGPIGEIENGDGAGVTIIMLVDGFSARVTAVYDSALTWPAEGDTVTLTLPKTGSTGGTQTYACVLTSYGPSIQRKREATIEMNLTYRPGITVT